MVDTGFSLIGKVLDFFAEFETFLFVIRPGFLSSLVSLAALRRSARGAKRRVYSSQNYTRSEATSFILCFLDLFLLFFSIRKSPQKFCKSPNVPLSFPVFLSSFSFLKRI